MAESGIRRLVSALLATMVAVAMLVVGSAPASACSCAELPPIELWELADEIFVGTQIDRIEHSITGDNGVSLFFEVTSVYKGEVGEVTEVFTHAQGSACGVDFADADEVLMVASEWEGKQNVNSCLTTELADLEALGVEPQPPDPDIAPPPDMAEADSYWLAGGLTALAGILIIFAILRLRDTNLTV